MYTACLLAQERTEWSRTCLSGLRYNTEQYCIAAKEKRVRKHPPASSGICYVCDICVTQELACLAIGKPINAEYTKLISHLYLHCT